MRTDIKHAQTPVSIPVGVKPMIGIQETGQMGFQILYVSTTVLAEDG